MPIERINNNLLVETKRKTLPAVQSKVNRTDPLAMLHVATFRCSWLVTVKVAVVSRYTYLNDE
jgi:hypothetical protein